MSTTQAQPSPVASGPPGTHRPTTLAEVVSARAYLDEVVLDALASGVAPEDVARAAAPAPEDSVWPD